MFSIQNIQELNDLEMSVYQYVMQHQDAIPYMRIREFASDAHVSTTTILRFCKKMGCDGYSEFKLKVKEHIGHKGNVNVPEDISELRVFLERMDSEIYQQKLNEAASIVAKADRVFCVGVSNSGYVAQYAARYFSGFGKFSIAITDPFYPMWQLNEIQNTVALVFSISGEVSQVTQITNHLKQHHCHIISITNTEKCTVAQLAELNLCHYITMRRGENNTDFKTHSMKAIIDYTSQAPALIIAETLAKRVAGRLQEN